jgi:hypothetical protein
MKIQTNAITDFARFGVIAMCAPVLLNGCSPISRRIGGAGGVEGTETNTGVVIKVSQSGERQFVCTSIYPIQASQLISIDLIKQGSDYSHLVIFVEPISDTLWDVSLTLVGPSIEPRHVDLGEVKVEFGGKVGIPLVRDGQMYGQMLFVGVTPTDYMLERLSSCAGRMPHESGLDGLYSDNRRD